MTILTRPAELSLLGNLTPITVTAATAEVTLTLAYDGGDTILTHTYTPTAAGTIEIQLRDILRPLLTFDLRDASTPYAQTGIVRAFSVTLTEQSATPQTSSFTFTAIHAGIDRFGGDAALRLHLHLPLRTGQAAAQHPAHRHPAGGGRHHPARRRRVFYARPALG